MMKSILFLLLTLSVCLTGNLSAQPAQPPFHPVNTYSIVCYDSITGQFGAAVQSHWFKVADVIWAEPGVGAVATQSFVEFSYGPLGLAMMKNGKTAKQALDGLIVSDAHSSVRQVAMIDANGIVAAFTGDSCIYAAGDRVGVGYSVQANLMENPTVWDAMAEAYEKTEGDLADRMMAALEAAQAEGGDIRGMQSAAMLVVSGKPTGMKWKDNLVDIRVDDSPQPLVELKRLLNITRAYDQMNRGDEQITEGDFDGAAKSYATASELAEGNLEILYWHAVTLASIGQVERSLPIFKKIFKQDESWRILTPRLINSGILPNDTAMLTKIISQ